MLMKSNQTENLSYVCLINTNIIFLATQEAVGLANPDILSLVIQHREYQNFAEKSGGMAEILEALEEVSTVVVASFVYKLANYSTACTKLDHYNIYLL